MYHYVLAFLVVASCAMVQSQFNPPTTPPGSIGLPRPVISPLLPTLDDIRLCIENAKGRTFKMVLKIPHQTCRPLCVYLDNVSEQINAIDNQMCCDIVGPIATGICKNGRCLMGGVIDVSGFWG